MSGRRVVVIGAGMGGLAAALRLRAAGPRGARAGSARESAGGLASGVEIEGFAFDGGPYILLDRPGLDWAFSRAGPGWREEQVTLRRLEHVYDVSTADGAHAALPRRRWTQTADGLRAAVARARARATARSSRAWPRTTCGCAPLLYRPPGRAARPAARRRLAQRAVPAALAGRRAARSSRLPQPLRDALGIWTHVAGQPLEKAPSVLAFVPALIHDVGRLLRGGRHRHHPARAGGRGRRRRRRASTTAPRVRRIACRDGRAIGVETEDGRLLEADAVVSNAGGVGTYLDLAPEIPARRGGRAARAAAAIAGVCAYLAVRGDPRGAYLRFVLHHRGSGAEPAGEACEPCHLWIRPAAVDPTLEKDGWWPARLLAPMDHARAERGGRAGQEAQLDRILEEPWWRAAWTTSASLGTRMPGHLGQRVPPAPRQHEPGDDREADARGPPRRTAAPGSAASTWPAAPRTPGSG